jgi:hypothetical protein
MTIDLYSSIIVNCSVGKGNSDIKINFENANGQLEQVSVQHSITKLME